MKLNSKHSIAWFVSPHGFGHAARASAVMDGLHALEPGLRFEIFTTVPEFFFHESIRRGEFGYHKLLTDIGLAQRSALISDIPETVRRLDDFLPFDGPGIEEPAAMVRELGCRLVVCDIAPMGIAVAKEAAIPSLLIENFTWAWIYEHYTGEVPAIVPHIRYLEQVFSSADYHLRTEPVCGKSGGNGIIPPISRKPVTDRAATRKNLDIPVDGEAVMISMGGVPEELAFVHRLEEYRDIWFIIPGSPSYSRKGNTLCLPHDSGVYHPDLIHACDAVIGKPGYSTLAEVYQAGIPFGSVARPNFRESAVMEDFIQKEMQGMLIPEKEFREGAWLNNLPELLDLPRRGHGVGNGADSAAEFIMNIL
jgi:hypothetical protein